MNNWKHFTKILVELKNGKQIVEFYQSQITDKEIKNNLDFQYGINKYSVIRKEIKDSEVKDMKFIYNDGGRSEYFKATNVGDCAVRAIAIATGIDYKKVYDDLKKLNGGKSCRNGTPKKVDKEYLTQLGWVWHSTMKIGQGCTVHLSADELPSGTLIVQVSKHLTCVKDGVLYDTYDCTRKGNRCVYGYWTPPYSEEQSAVC